MLKKFVVVVVLGGILGVGAAAAMEYPLEVGVQVVYDVTSSGVNQPMMHIRYEMDIIGLREAGQYEAVWSFKASPGTAQEVLGGAIPLVIGQNGQKQFPMQRQATYLLQEMAESLLPQLPNSFDKAWKGPDLVTGRYYSYSPLPKGPTGMTHCSFAGYGLNNMDQVVGYLTRGEIVFDPRTNFPQSLRFSTVQTQPDGQKTTISQANVTLTSVSKKGSDWAEQRRQEARTFFATISRFDDANLKATTNIAAATVQLEPLRQIWSEYLSTNPSSFFTPLASNHLNMLQMETPVLQQLWMNRKSIVGRAAPTWTLNSLGGSAYSLESMANRPVVIVFWFRGNWESLMALREAADIQTKYGANGLQVVAINVDQTDQMAREALDILALNQHQMLQLRNTDANLLSQYGITFGLPATILLDSNHRIVDLQFGWGQRVFQNLRATINQLF